MRWTDYCRIKDELNQIEDNIKWLRQALKYGSQEEIELEATAVQSGLDLLRHIRGHFIDSFFDIRMTKMEKEAESFLTKANMINYKKNMEADKNGKTGKSI